jgi:hypothetical protein
MSFIGIGVGLGASALGMGSIGAGITGGVVGGTATSAIMSAAQGKPITAKDLLIGAGTGAVTGGVGGAIAAPAKVATSLATETGKIGGQAATKVGTEAATKVGTEAATKVGTEATGKLASQGTGQLSSQAGGQGFDKAMGATRASSNLAAPTAPAGFGPTPTAPTGGVANLPNAAPNMGMSSVAKVNPNAIASPTSGLSSGNIEGSSIGANSFDSAMAGGPTAPTTATPSEGMFGSGISTGSKGADTALEKGAVSGVMKGGEEGLGAYQLAQYNADIKKADKANAADAAANAALGQNMANDLYPNQMKTSMLAKGGPVHMESGSFVIPADIVSALGDGSTEAGFRFLESFFKDAEEA